MDASGVESRADWPFVRNGAVTLFHGAAILDAAIEAVTRDGYAAHRVDCGSEIGMVRDLASALRWREAFGYEPARLDLDALDDAFGTEPCTERPRLVLVLNRFAEFHDRDRRGAHRLLDLIECNSRDHLLFGRRLLAFVHIDDPTLHIDGLGGRAAQWNPKEWLKKSRGV